MTGSFAGRDDEVEALIVDRYLESLLARRPRDDGRIPAELDDAALRLAAALPRFHPSFRFEEALAARLAAAGRRVGTVGEADLSGVVIPLIRPVAAPVTAGDRVALARPVVIGSVVTSAAISLAGAAFVAWRRTRPNDTMARAVRAVARTRIA